MIAIHTGNILMFVAGTALTWSSPEMCKLTDPSTSPFSRTLTNDEATWVSSLITLGAAAGPFIFGCLADKMGRKFTLLSLGIPFMVGYLMLAFGRIVELYYVARFVMGLSVGGVFTVMPIYTGEIADKHNRGALGATMSCAVCSGLMFSYSLGPFVSVMVFNLVLAVFPVVFLFLFVFLGSEVPHYYISINEGHLAKEALQKLRGNYGCVDDELYEIQTKFKEEERGTFCDIFRSKALIQAFITSCGLLMFQQFSGINIVLFYSQRIFQEVGSGLKPEICAIIIGSVQFLSSFISPLIGTRFGRKNILTFSAAGMIISEASLGAFAYLKERGFNVEAVSYLPVVILTGFIISYNSGYGPLPWAMLGELFPSRVKSIATSAVNSITWLMAFILTKYFTAMLTAFGLAYYMWFYSICCLFAGLFSKFYVLETQGKTLEEIQEDLSR